MKFAKDLLRTMNMKLHETWESFAKLSTALSLQAGHPDWWFFKVKRYPWNVSYGNKHADKAIEATKTLLEKQKVSLPPPSNMDAESAKSLLIFLLKVRTSDIYS